MDLRNLELFLHLADSLHFGKSADAMAVSPSTLSRAIQRLEQETGCVLFERDNRSVRLTPAGEKLREFGGSLLQEWRRLKQELRRSDEPLQGRLRVFCSVTASYFLLPEVLERFRRRYPQLEIKLETGDPAPSMGTYLRVMSVLGVSGELALLAGDALQPPPPDSAAARSRRAAPASSTACKLSRSGHSPGAARRASRSRSMSLTKLMTTAPAAAPAMARHPTPATPGRWRPGSSAARTVRSATTRARRRYRPGRGAPGPRPPAGDLRHR